MLLKRAIKTRLRRFVAAAAVLTLGLVVALPVSADSGGGQTLRIGVGHSDPENQQVNTATGSPLNGGRVWSYMDFFTRDVTIHSGDTLDFQTPPREFHVVAVAKDGPTLRENLPLFLSDNDDPPAPGSGAAKVLAGPGVFAFMQFPSCGLELAGQPNCTFNGNAPIIAGAVGGAHVKKLLQVITQGKKLTPAAFNGTVDWNVTVNAPPGDYNYLCLIHPKMNGTFHVVGASQAATTQGTINAQSLTQFAADKAEGLAKYAADNTPTSTVVDGQTVWAGHAGDNTADGHVGFFEMMPRNLNVGVLDAVKWTWGPDSELHTVSFLTDSAFLPPPFGPDCIGPPGSDDDCSLPPPNLEFATDPGNARPGVLSNTNPLDPASVVDSGVLVGADYLLPQPVQDWSANANATGTYAYQCTIHDWMRATVTVS